MQPLSETGGNVKEVMEPALRGECLSLCFRADGL